MQTKPKYLYFIVGIIFSIGIISCKDKSEKPEPAPSYLDQNAAELSKNIDLQGVISVENTKQSENALSNWSEFTSANSEIEKIKSSSLRGFIDNSSSLYDAVEKIHDSIPKPFDNNPIESRMNVLKTKIEVLNQDLDRPDLSPEMVNQHARDIYIAFQNLKIQLNEVFLRQVSDLEFDMDARQDSIQRANRK